MKTFLKITAICAFVLFVFSAQAQVQFGVKAGLNLANGSAKFGGESQSSDMKMGLHIGAIVDLSLGESLALQPGLLFSMKGQQEDYEGVTVKTNINYLEVPINLMYKFDAGNMKIMAFAGPYLGYALSAKMKAEDEEMELNIGTDENEDDIKPLDLGLNIGAGVQFGGLQITANYGLGMANLLPGGDSDNYAKNRVIGISVAYLFGGK